MRISEGRESESEMKKRGVFAGEESKATRRLPSRLQFRVVFI